MKKPCKSCQIFFQGSDYGRRDHSLPPFGNCAEYDIIRTSNLDGLLRLIDRNNHWTNFKSACHQHINAFNNLLSNNPHLENPQSLSQNRDIMKRYYATIADANPKVLIYISNNDLVRFPFTRLERSDRSNCSNGKQNVQL